MERAAPTKAGVRCCLWFLFATAVCPAIFLAGVYVEGSRIFPYSWVRAVYKTRSRGRAMRTVSWARTDVIPPT